jgi:hypothetical protein
MANGTYYDPASNWGAAGLTYGQLDPRAQQGALAAYNALPPDQQAQVRQMAGPTGELNPGVVQMLQRGGPGNMAQQAYEMAPGMRQQLGQAFAGGMTRAGDVSGAYMPSVESAWQTYGGLHPDV